MFVVINLVIILMSLWSYEMSYVQFCIRSACQAIYLHITFFFWIHCSVVSFDHVSFVQLHGIIEALLIVQLAGLLCTYGCRGI
jgi:hypothetical protein